MNKEIAVGALDVLYNLVAMNEAIELTALVVCDDIALGRFRIRFLESLGGSGDASMSLNVTALQ